jgi:hypothetical protein
MTSTRVVRNLAAAAAVMLGAALATVPTAADAGSTTPVAATQEGEWGTAYGLLSGNGRVTALEDGAGVWRYDRTTGERERLNLGWDGERIDVNLRDISDDGRFVLFSSRSSNVLEEEVPDDCGFWSGDEGQEEFNSVQCLQLYVTDTAAGTTELASVGLDGNPVPNGSQTGSLSGDGQFLAMETGTPTPTEQDHPSQTLLRDLAAGVTEDVAVHPDGTPTERGAGGMGVDVSDDGKLVLFGAGDGTLAGPSDEEWGFYVRDRSAGTTSRLFPESAGLPQYTMVYDLSMSDDGDVVTFVTNMPLVPEDTDNAASAYVYDRPTNTFTLPGPGTQESPRLSGDGKFLAYLQYSDPEDNRYDIHVLDIAAGTTELASVSSSGAPIGKYTWSPSISGDGRFLGFQAIDSEIRPGEPGEEPYEQETARYYVRDLAPPTDNASGAGTASTGADPTVTDSLETSVSGSPGAIAIEELQDDPSPLTGWNVLGQQVRITAAPVTAPGGFMTFTFTVDRSVVPPGAALDDVQLLRNGEPLTDCADVADAGPCVVSRLELGSGDWQVVAHSPQASVWALATAMPDSTPPDETGPAIALQTPAEGAIYKIGQRVVASYTCADDSEVELCAGPVASGSRVNTSTIGPRTFTVNARDGAGNTSTASAAYRVVWPLTGLLAPIDGPPVVNTVKRGSVVPVVFSLGGYRGKAVFASGSPSSARVGCNAGTRADALERTLKSSAPRLSYAGGKYTYAWKTDKAWRGTCRRLVVRFADGQERTALFGFW